MRQSVRHKSAESLHTIILAFTVSPMIHKEWFLLENDIKGTSESVHCHVVVFALIWCRVELTRVLWDALKRTLV